MDISKIFEFIKSKTLVALIAILFAVAVLLGTFSAGVAVGYRKARFSYAWGENYHKNFAGPRRGFLVRVADDFSGADFIGAHGAFGQILSTGDSEIVIRGKDGIEKVIAVTEDTDIRKFRDVVEFKDLKIDDSIVIIGEPNDEGQIEAKFIRAMPENETGFPYGQDARRVPFPKSLWLK